jgi:hypothetical protein
MAETPYDQLSTAAKAVLDAGLPHAVHRFSVAAALRAAAGQGKLGPNCWEGSQPDDREQGWNEAMAWIERIAAELEQS